MTIRRPILPGVAAERRPLRPTSMLLPALLMLMVFGLASTACGDDEDGDGSGSAGENEMTVSQALEQEDGTGVTVQGFLIEDGGVLYLSETIAESFPPQPGGPRAEVVGIDIGQLDGVNTEGPVRWLDNTVTVNATVQDGRLVDAEVAG